MRLHLHHLYTIYPPPYLSLSLCIEHIRVSLCMCMQTMGRMPKHLYIHIYILDIYTYIYRYKEESVIYIRWHCPCSGDIYTGRNIYIHMHRVGCRLWRRPWEIERRVKKKPKNKERQRVRWFEVTFKRCVVFIHSRNVFTYVEGILADRWVSVIELRPVCWT